MNADATGHATATVTIPAGLFGAHTLVASGLAPNGSQRFLLTGSHCRPLPVPASPPVGRELPDPADPSTIADTGLADVDGIALLGFWRCSPVPRSLPLADAAHPDPSAPALSGPQPRYAPGWRSVPGHAWRSVRHNGPLTRQQGARILSTRTRPTRRCNGPLQYGARFTRMAL